MGVPTARSPRRVISTWEVATPADLQLIADQTATDRDRLDAVERLLLDHRQEARIPIHQLIDSDQSSPGLRAAALRMCTQTWGTCNFHAMASILETSPDGDPRLAAAEALAAYDAGLGIGFSTATYYLLQALCNDPSPTVKQVACRSLLTTLGHPEQIPTDFHPDRIDWDLINHLIPPDA